MQAVILAGGLGTRLSEETHLRPKPMVEIGGKPILWHILKTYSSYDINDFIICCGYKGYVIKEYFANYMLHVSDVTIDLNQNGTLNMHVSSGEPWRITLVDTGENSMTGGRLKRVKDYIKQDTFCFTYGDGLANVDLQALIEFHHKSDSIASLTAVQPPGRYGALNLDGTRVCSFQEKPQGDNAWINGGFFVLDKCVIQYINDDSTNWESEVLPHLAVNGLLQAYKHFGFWQPMDTLRDKNQLETLWASGMAPWKTW